MSICIDMKKEQIYCCGKELSGTIDFLKKIADQNRLKILCHLKNKKEACVCELEEVIGIKHNLILHHLHKLQELGIIASRKEQKHTYYRLKKIVFNDHLAKLKYVLEE